MGGEKKPLVMSDLGCADGCGRQMGAENCADGCGRRGCKGVAGNGWGEEAAGDERPWLRGRLRTANAADGVGATEWLEMGGEKGKEGKGWERKGQEGKGRDRKGKEGKGWERKEKGRERKGKEGKGWERKGKDGKGKEKDRKGKERKGMERTAADGLGAREWLEMGGEKKPLGDERPWLRGRLRTANGCGELRGRLRTAWVQGGGWKWVERRSRW